MCHINYTLSVTTRITHQPSVCSKTLRQVAADAFCWTQGPSSILITNHTCVLQWRTQKMFSFFLSNHSEKNCLCYCVVDLLRCPALLPPLLTKHINYVTWETVSDANCYSVIFLKKFLTLYLFISHTCCLIVILLKKVKNKQTNKVSPTFSAAFGSIRCYLGIRKNGWQSGCGDKRSSFRRADETRRKVEMCCWQRWITVVE